MTNSNQNQTIIGQVLTGQNKGAKTGAHTANLDVSLAKNLARGLYFCSIKLQEQNYHGLLYYGHNSLSQKDCLEAHLLNFSQNIYGQTIEITIKQFLRPEIKFNNLVDLQKQIKKDLIAVKKLI